MKVCAPTELVKDAMKVMRLLASCLQSHWTYCKENFPHVDIADPGFDPTVAVNTLRIAIFYAYQAVDSEDPQEHIPPIAKPATEIIRYISASNWSVCDNVWKTCIQSCTSVEGKLETRTLRMIGDMVMHLDGLASIMKGPHSRGSRL
jgi:hypothetical protein